MFICVVQYIHQMDYSTSYQLREFVDAPVHDIDLTAEINERMWDYRQLDRGPRLNPDLSGRPQFTKYSLYHTFDSVKEPFSSGEPDRRLLNSGTSTVTNENANQAFHASAQHGQPSLFRQIIDTESAIQNRGLVAIQRADQGIYVPGPAPAGMYVRDQFIVPGRTCTRTGTMVGDGHTAGVDFARDYLHNQTTTQGNGGMARAFGIQTRAKNS